MGSKTSKTMVWKASEKQTNFEENFGSNLGNDCSHSQCGATSLVNFDYFSYSAYNLDSEMFRFCSDIYEINEETQVQGHAYVIFNNIELDFPIYTGKTWTGNIEDLPGPYIYEVLSLETLTVNIQNEPMIFDAYKIGVFHDSFAEMVFYLSPIGILKISYTSHDMEITNEYHETGEFFNYNVNVELIDYDI